MIRVIIPYHLKSLAQITGEVELDIPPPVTLRSVLDALESGYPMLRGTIRDHVTGKRRDFRMRSRRERSGSSWGNWRMYSRT